MTLTASSLALTTPTMLPLMSISGPPLLPACTGAVIWMVRSSSRKPRSALT
jgi:hypothetical protein